MKKSNKEPFKKWWMWLAIVLLFVIVLQNINKKNEYSSTAEPVENEVVEEVLVDVATTDTLNNKTTETKEQISEEVAEAKEIAGSNKETAIPKTDYIGIGSTKSQIEAKYGENRNEDDEIGSYQNKTLLIFYSDGEIADNLSYEYGSDPQTRRTIKEALVKAKDFLPSDVQKVKEYDADQEHHVVVYKSEKLAEFIPSYYQIATELGSTDVPGTVSVYTKQDEAGVYMFGVVLGNYQ
ncbi:hypothetical protein [Paenibacillus kandeliae]|uniref:hypothetical protein n=1 Tax=Paenibacillus kandeliae TaxID=3231269 RepID=UPI003458FEF8